MIVPKTSRTADGHHRFAPRVWGFSCDAACECVGRLARDVLRRTDHEGFALGPDRIEQIYKDMLKSFSPPPRRQGITRRWLQGVRVWRLRRPDGSFFRTPTLNLLAKACFEATHHRTDDIG